MSDEQLPRVWVGYEERVSHWAWDGDWVLYRVPEPWSVGLVKSDIFVPGNQPKPTIDPAQMTEMKTCKEVDWT